MQKEEISWPTKIRRFVANEQTIDVLRALVFTTVAIVLQYLVGN